MNIKLNKYINNFKATSILFLCVNKIIPPLHNLVSQYQWWCVIFYNYHYPQVLEPIHVIHWITHLNTTIGCLVLSTVSLLCQCTPLCWSAFYVLCFTYRLRLPTCLCDTFVFYLRKGNQLWYLHNIFILLYADFLMSSCIKILLLKQNIIFNCNIMFLVYCFQASQSILGAQWWR